MSYLVLDLSLYNVTDNCYLFQLTLRTELEYATYIASFLFGVFGLAAYPVGLELSAECTFPVPENLSTGFIVIVGQVSPFIITFLRNLIINFFCKEFLI